MDGNPHNSKLFHLYKKISNGRLMHLTSIRFTDRIAATAHYKKDWNIDEQYIVTGLTKNINEDISRDFPVHIQRRIEYKGIKKREAGYLYQYVLAERNKAK